MTFVRPPTQEGALRLHLNENTAGCSPAVIEAVRRVTSQDVAFYPEYDQLYRECADHLGLTERQIARRHVFRNALLPVVTMAGVQAGAMLGGAVVVETVFAWPGLGLLAYESLFARDLNLLLGIFFVSTCLVVLVNLVVDLAYSFLDPRIELR